MAAALALWALLATALQLVAAADTSSAAPGGATVDEKAARTAAATVEAKPTQLWSDCRGSYCGGPLVCPVGYEMHCRKTCGSCSALGPLWSARWEQYEGCGRGHNAEKCCICTAPSAPAASPLPTKLGETCEGGRCTMELSCPAWHELSAPRSICTRGSSCSALGAGYIESTVTKDIHCDSGYWDELTEKTCVTCEPCPSCAPPATTTTLMPQPPAPTTPRAQDGRGWELVGGPWNRACRGDNASDDHLGLYDAYSEVPTLEDCKTMCIDKLQWRCRGVEYNSIDHRCELWHREAGIFAFAEPATKGYSCLRYGWPAMHLHPVDGGVGRACRGEHADDESEDHYTLEKVWHMEDCRARCVRSRVCRGIEFSARYGRCEIWKRPIRATKEMPGFECLRYEGPGASMAPTANLPLYP